MANETAMATKRLFETFYLNHSRPTATAQALKLLADTLGRDLTKPVVEAYLASLGELSVRELILSFSRALDESRYFPVPATLREFSGRAVDDDHIAREAKEELLKLIEGCMDPHGPTLKPLLGRVLYGTEDDPRDKDGVGVGIPIRGESTPFPIARRTEAVLVRLGWGDRTAGIALIADHPAVKRSTTVGYADPLVDAQYKTNQLRAGDEILKRFTDAYGEV